MAARVNRAKHHNVVLGSRKRQQHAIIPLSGRKDPGARSPTRWASGRPGATLKRTGVVLLEPVPFVDAGDA